MAASSVRFEQLNYDNYETWRIQVKAVLVRNETWAYASGASPRPRAGVDNGAGNGADVQDAVNKWVVADEKAQSDIVLAMSPPVLKLIRGCETAREMWLKLESVFQSRGPARKVALLNKLVSHKMADGADMRESTQAFLDVVDKLADLDIDIHKDLLSVMMLKSLPESYENFRCAISSRDDLPSPDILRTKILEEFDARMLSSPSEHAQDAMVTRRPTAGRSDRKKDSNGRRPGEIRCFRCGKMGHIARECSESRESAGHPRKRAETGKQTERKSFHVSEQKILEAAAHGTSRCRDERIEGHWCIDSGATSHVCGDADVFERLSRGVGGKLNLANHAQAEIAGEGIARIVANLDGRNVEVDFHKTLYVPDLRTNLVSVAKITDKGHKVVFNRRKATVVDRNGCTLLSADRVGDLYLVRCPETSKPRKNVVVETATKAARCSLQEWHVRLGHLNLKALRAAVNSGSITGLSAEDLDGDFSCETCVEGKMTRTPFPKASERKSELGELIHSDLCGPMRVPSIGGNVYFATFIDDRSGWCEVRFLRRKNQVLEEFRGVRELFETHVGRRPKMLQSDNGLEYMGREFEDELRRSGMRRRTSAPYCPEQNGVAERRNRTLMEMARCLLIQAGLPPRFWAEAIYTANYLRNRCPTSRLQGKTPHEAWFGEVPDAGHLRRFGCEVRVLNPRPGKSKLSPRTKDGIFMGYSLETKAYRVWLPHEQRIAISRDVVFLEKPPHPAEDRSGRLDLQAEPCDDNSRSDDEDGEMVVDLELHPVPVNDVESAVPEPQEQPRVATRGRGRPRWNRTGQRGRPRKVYCPAGPSNGSSITAENGRETRASERQPAETATEFEVDVADEESGETAGERPAEFTAIAEVPLERAVSGPESDEWMQAMAKEAESILKNDTWTIVQRPVNRNVVGSRFVLRNKFGADGVLERRKARIVARGFSQVPGRDFNETFAPVARLSSVRLAMAIAARKNMKVRQFDVATAYLNGTLEEEIFMEVPERFKDVLRYVVDNGSFDSRTIARAKVALKELRGGNRVCLLKKALYGLKQAGRAWHRRLDRVLRDLGAIPTAGDPCVYVKGAGDDRLIVVVYVDDILAMSRVEAIIERFGDDLRNHFEITDAGDLKRCLGIDFKKDRGTITMCQRTYIAELLQRFNMQQCNSVATPLDPGTKLTRTGQWKTSDGEKPPYRELVGGLLYLSVATRPDVAHAASLLSQFNDCFGKAHWSAAKRVLRYLKGTTNVGITFRHGGADLHGYADADWAGSLDDRRSYTGYAFTMNGGCVSWDSRKQRTVALSTTEAEYMALCEAAKEAVHLRRFMRELGENEQIVALSCDNVGARELATNAVFHARTKHIDIRHHFLREIVNSGAVKLEYTESEKMPADALTKALTRDKHQRCLIHLGLLPGPVERHFVKGEC